MTPVRLTYPSLTPRDLPPGLSIACSRTSCRRELTIGDPYAELPTGFSGDGNLQRLIVCVYCANRPAPLEGDRVPGRLTPGG